MRIATELKMHHGYTLVDSVLMESDEPNQFQKFAIEIGPNKPMAVIGMTPRSPAWFSLCILKNENILFYDDGADDDIFTLVMDVNKLSQKLKEYE
jgi:hypothetical protein